MAATIKLKRGNRDLWVSVDPVLSDGEPGYENDTGFLKVGDGVTPYNSLPYYPEAAIESIDADAGSAFRVQQDARQIERIKTEHEWVIVDAPVVGDSTAALEAAGALALSSGKKGVLLRGGVYTCNSKEIIWPDRVRLSGMGPKATTISTGVLGSFRFGKIDGIGAAQQHIVTDLSFTGGQVTPTIVRIGHIVKSLFSNVEVRSGKVGFPAVLVETAQNTLFHEFHVTGSDGGGIKWDYGPANITMIGCQVITNADYNHLFTATGPAPEGTSGSNSPRNIHIYGGLTEDSEDSAIIIESGVGVEFFGVQTSMNAVTLTPALHMRSCGPLSYQKPQYVNWVGGQLKGGGLDPTYGVAAKVEEGTLFFGGGANLRNASVGMQIGDNGFVKLGDYYREAVTTEFAALGTKPVRALLTRHGGRTGKATAAHSITSTVLADMGGLAAYNLSPNADYEVRLQLITSGDTTADLKIGFTFPADAFFYWGSNAMATNSNVLQATSSHALLSGALTQECGTTAASQLITVTGLLITGDTGGGTLQLQAALADAATGTASIAANSRIVVNRLH